MMLETWLLDVGARMAGGVHLLMAAHLLALAGVAYLLGGVVRLLFLLGTVPQRRVRRSQRVWLVLLAAGCVLAGVGLLYRIAVAQRLGTAENCAHMMAVAGALRPYCSVSWGGVVDYGGQALLSWAGGVVLHKFAGSWARMRRGDRTRLEEAYE